jgi:hypothetical protein
LVVHCCACVHQVIKSFGKLLEVRCYQLVVYLDDGFGAEQNRDLALQSALRVRSDLQKSGLVENVQKSIWVPCQEMTWLGTTANLLKGILFVPTSKIQVVKVLLKTTIQNGRATARQLAVIMGKISSMHLVLGTVAKLMSKYVHMAVCTQHSWDFYFQLEHQVLSELRFWLVNLNCLSSRNLFKSCATTRICYSDASDTGCAGYEVSVRDSISHRMWSPEEARESSTYRELLGVCTVMTAIPHVLTAQSVKWFTDNQGVVSIINNGSMKPKLQELAVNIYQFAVRNCIKLEICWVPREYNDKADQLSRLIDYNDWGISHEFFNCLENKWGPHTCDRFANCTNNKVENYNSRFWSPGASAIDAFTQTWSRDNNLLVPPIHLIGRVIRYVLLEKSKATLVVPYWTSAAFWPLIVTRGGKFRKFVTDFWKIDNATNVFIAGSTQSIFGPDFKSGVLALKLH